jgi:UV excision repair protein RAD23
MKLTFKTLQQQQFSIEAEPTENVGTLKQKIEKDHSHPVQAQKLILKGKILGDELLVGDMGVSEKDFIVLMVTKPKPVSTATTPVQPTPTQSQPAPQPTPAPVVSPAVQSHTPAAVFDASTLATGSALNTAVENMVEMGFPKEQVMAAMRAAFNNPDRAVEYLMTGIPEGLQEQVPTPQAEPQPNPPAADTAATSTQAGQLGEHVNLFQQAQQQAQLQNRPAVGATGAANADLEALRNSPQFQHLRRLVQSQPHLLPPMLQQIEQTNPQLMQVYWNNVDNFSKSGTIYAVVGGRWRRL